MNHFFSFLAGVAFASNAFAASPLPERSVGFVNDLAGVLSGPARSEIENELRVFAANGNPQIVVATIPSLDGDQVEDYANRLFRQWGIGDKTKNNGVLFLIAPNDRKMRIEVGYGLEGALTDVETKRIQEDIVKPDFQKLNYENGIRTGVHAIEEGLKGEIVSPKRERAWNMRDMESLFFLVIILLSWFGSILGRSKSWWAGGVVGVVGGGIAWAFTQWLYWVPIVAVFGFVFDYFVSKNYKEHLSNHHPAWWAGGGWGGWDRFGGGGGFGGPPAGGWGGSSGGGGSSSSW